MNRNELAVRLAALPLVCWVGIAAVVAQGPISATLVSNDIAYAELWDPTNGECQSQVLPPGPFTATHLAVQGVTLSGNLAPTATGWSLVANASYMGASSPNIFGGHADWTLTLSAAPGTVAAIAIDVSHGGDGASSNGLRVDYLADGTIDVHAAGLGYCQFSHANRHWTWDFAQGDLSIRMMSDGGNGAGAQGYGLDLKVTPWVAAATPVAEGSGGVGYLWSSSTGDFESSNYQIAALQPTGATSMATLRANGFGPFGAFLVADNQTMMPIALPSPFATTCDLLAGVLFFDQGIVSANTTLVALVPRQWDLVVPQLPPGITFYVQHASALPIAPFPFGSSNVLRIDT